MIIVGAGIGGLASAAALRKVGKVAYLDQNTNTDPYLLFTAWLLAGGHSRRGPRAERHA